MYLQRLLVSLSLLLVLLTGCGAETLTEGSGGGGDVDRLTMGDAPALDEGPAPVAVEVPEGAPRVVVLGDSIAAGLHLAADRAFPAVLSRLAAEEGHPFHLVNAGVSGDTSAGGLRRVDWVLEQTPDVLILELGGNDGLRGQPLAEIENNLGAIIDKAQGVGAKVLLFGMRIPTSYGEDYAEGFAALYPRLAAEKNVAFLPYFMEGVGGVPEMNLEDELHPSIEGHEKLARNALPALLEVLRAL